MQNGAGYKIIGCQLGGTRSRGILAKADAGLIENNRIIELRHVRDQPGPGVLLGRGRLRPPRGGGGQRDRAATATPDTAGRPVFVHGDGAVGNGDITVRGNRFVSNYQGDMDIQWVDGMTVAGNVITGAPQWPSTMPAQSPISLANCRAVTLSGNVVQHASVYKPALVAVGD